MGTSPDGVAFLYDQKMNHYATVFANKIHRSYPKQPLFVVLCSSLGKRCAKVAKVNPDAVSKDEAPAAAAASASLKSRRAPAAVSKQ